MTISLSEWARYRDALSKLNQKAADEFRDYFFHRNGALGGIGLREANREDVIKVAYAIATKYGEGSAALAAEFYDEVAAASGVFVPPAVPAETATYTETAKTMNKALSLSDNTDYVSSFVGALTKRAGQDTIVQNASRDSAQFAWVPFGNTCPYCLALASKGWQYAGKNAKIGHAEHIHGNCDCAYSVRFKKSDGLAGYNPDKYLEMYQDADGKTSKDKINAMRREQYAENKEFINEQKREAYALRVEAENSTV